MPAEVDDAMRRTDTVFLIREVGPDTAFRAMEIAPSVGADTDRDGDRDRHDGATQPDLHTGGVEPDIGQSPSSGWFRKVWIFSSISPHGRDILFLQMRLCL